MIKKLSGNRSLGTGLLSNGMLLIIFGTAIHFLLSEFSNFIVILFEKVSIENATLISNLLSYLSIAFGFLCITIFFFAVSVVQFVEKVDNTDQVDP